MIVSELFLRYAGREGPLQSEKKTQPAALRLWMVEEIELRGQSWGSFHRGCLFCSFRFACVKWEALQAADCLHRYSSAASLLSLFYFILM